MQATTAYDSLRRLDKALAVLRALRLGRFATPHPNGAFGLPPNTWDVPPFVQRMAEHAIAEIERETKERVCICPSHASNRGECPIHDEKGRVRAEIKGET
jgi:hypothetical protein